LIIQTGGVSFGKFLKKARKLLVKNPFAFCYHSNRKVFVCFEFFKKIDAF
jgi:hypothetical protein